MRRRNENTISCGISSLKADSLEIEADAQIRRSDADTYNTNRYVGIGVNLLGSGLSSFDILGRNQWFQRKRKHMDIIRNHSRFRQMLESREHTHEAKSPVLEVVH